MEVMKVEKKTIRCDICGKDFKPTDIVLGALVRDTVADMIRKDFPGWSSESHICREDLSNYRTDYVHTLLETEKGELTELEKEVIDSLNKNEIIASDVDSEFEQIWTFGEKLADHIASFGGSWSFLILFALFLILWIGINSFVLFWRPVDPYPFILLNLLLSPLFPKLT